MENAHLHIKNMVCPRCISTVTQVLSNAGLPVQEVTLGAARLSVPEAEVDFADLNSALQQEGFELIYDREKQLAEQIKNQLINYLEHFQTHYEPVTTSTYLTDKLNLPYQQLSKIFSRQEHTTIEKYFIRLKIEKVKELLLYDELNLTEIAWKLHYSSVAHLSSQFKKVTGLTPSFFKQLKHKRKLTLENV